MTFRHGLRSIALWVGLAALVVVLCLAAIVLGAHLPWVQARVGQWAASQLLARGITIRTAALSYNLATLSVHVERLVASTTTDTQHPFLEAARLDVAFPRSILRGRVAISSLAGDGIRLTVVRRPDGSTNLPEAKPSGGTESSSPFPIRALALSNVSIVWQDEVLGMSAEADRLSLNLLPTARGSTGALTLGRPVTLRAGGRTTELAMTARIGWNGSTLSTDSLQLSTPEASLTAVGSVGLLSAGLPMAIDANGSVDLNRVAAWLGPGPNPSGHLTFRAHATGSLNEPRADLTLGSQDLAWQGLTNVAADASAQIDRTAVESRIHQPAPSGWHGDREWPCLVVLIGSWNRAGSGPRRLA